MIRNQQTILGTMQTRVTCSTCGGEGKIIKNKCKKCGGDGIIYGEEVVSVKSLPEWQRVYSFLWVAKEMPANTMVWQATC